MRLGAESPSVRVRWISEEGEGAARDTGEEGSVGELGLPDVEELVIAGGGDGDFLLAGGAAEGGADVFFGVGEFGEGDFECGAFGEVLDIVEQLGDDLFVFAVAAFGDVGLEDGFEPDAVGLDVVFVVHGSPPLAEMGPLSM